MPIYEYQCDECGALFEVMQKMSDDPLTECEKCGGPLRKVLHPVAIHFKGSGFYTTDYGKGSGRRAGARDGSGETSPTSEPASSSDAGAAKKDKTSGSDGKAKEKQKAT